MIELKNVVKKYGERVILHGISFSVEKGEVLGFLGPNGAGKTTTMRIITGYLSASSGDVVVDGYNVRQYPNKVKGIIGYLPELAPAYHEMTVLGYLKFMAGIKGVPGNMVNSALQRVISQSHVENVKDRLIGNLSRGYRQRVGIAQALLNDPKILILDEPTVGLDPEQIIEIRNLINDLGKDHTIILSTHILPEVAITCTRVLVINDGKLLTHESFDNLSKKLQDEKVFSLIPTRIDDKMIASLKTIEKVISVTTVDREISIKTENGFDKPELISEAVFKSGGNIIKFAPETFNMEDIYIKLISQDRGGAQ